MPGAYSTGRTDAQEDEMIHLRYHSHPCGLALQYLHLLLKQASSNSIRIWKFDQNLQRHSDLYMPAFLGEV